jgi:hypothetical protein
MLFRREAHRAAPRRGVILIVVLALLTLFAIVGISFVLFSDSAAQSARINAQAENQTKPDVDPELALALFLSQMIYDVPDDDIGTQSALRGHSFARTMYGANFTVVGREANGRPIYGGENSLPYCGIGRYHKIGARGEQFPGVDEHNLVNYQFVSGDGFVRDPERVGTRTDPSKPFAANTHIAANAPYTYCDGNSMFLAYMDSQSGEIKVPSFHRPWLGFGSLEPNNPNWRASGPTNKHLKYMVMCPRQAEHPNFPKTLDAGGHVKNLDGAPGGCDSIWIDIGAPVMTMADGRKYKMLVAPLILDLDGRLNLNVAGNVLGAGHSHASNQGWGAWEMNPAKALNAPIAPQEWKNLFVGSSYTNTTNNYGRYGPNVLPDGTPPSGGTFLHDYAKIDFNGIVDAGPGAGSPTSNYLLAGAPNRPLPPWHSFPYFPPDGYGNAVPVETTPYHPSTYNTLRPSGDNRQLSVQSMHTLLRYGGSGSDYVTSDLRILRDNLFLDPTPNPNAPGYTLATKRRNQVTTLSMDLDRPGVIPFILDPKDMSAAGQTNRFRLATLGVGLPPVGTAIAFPDLSSRTDPNFIKPQSEFDKESWRSVFAALGRVNLSRNLAPYPRPNNGQLNPNDAQYQRALADRQQLAQDLFDVLRKVSGAMAIEDARTFPTFDRFGRPVPIPPGTSFEYQALRWLAQLAVNIVDYIDEDDYMTPFHWDPNNTVTPDRGWVFGVELPRLVLNEAYAQLENDPNDPKIQANAPSPKQASTNYVMNVWLELHNPLPAETNPNQHPNSNQAAELQIGNNAVYRVLLTDQLNNTNTGLNGPLDNHANVTGDPDFDSPAVSRVFNTFTGWGPNPVQQIVLPANGAYSGPVQQNQGFYAIGPPPGSFFDPADDPRIPTTFTTPALSYKVPLASVPTPTITIQRPPPPRVLEQRATMPNVNAALQRLACPHLPANPMPGKPGNNPALPPNPYITTDVLKLRGTNDPVNNATQVWDMRHFLSGPPPAGPGAGPDHNDPFRDITQAGRCAYGRKQPYSGFSNFQMFPQNRALLPGERTNPLPRHTFYRHNGFKNAPPLVTAADFGFALKQNFDWLVHLDRRLISPMELLNVSAVKPHELTQTFIEFGSEGNNSDLAEWAFDNSRLYRFFEFVTTGGLQNGYAPGGRVPGRININTLGPNDVEIFRALCDAQPGNSFTAKPTTVAIAAAIRDRQVGLVTITTVANHGFSIGESVVIRNVSPTEFNGTFTIAGVPDAKRFTYFVPTAPPNPRLVNGSGGSASVFKSALIDPIFKALIAHRSPNGVPGPGDRPYLSLATGHAQISGAGDAVSAARQRGLDDTLLRLTRPGNDEETSTLMLEPLRDDPFADHPYRRFELLNKIYNNLTVRSNVFAIWMTVGFFEVEDDQTLPVRLGAEIGRQENRHVRHRMFAIVDRTNLTMLTTTTGADNLLPGTTQQVFDVNGLNGLLPQTTGLTRASNLQWEIKPNMVLTFEPNTNNEESATVLAGALPGRLQVRLFRSHPKGSAVIVRGNPGPHFRYNPRNDTGVVPYLAIID